MDHLRHLAEESDRFATTLATADPTAPVPSCPDWTAADLLWHLTEVQGFWGSIVAGRLQDPELAVEPTRPDTLDEMFASFAATSTALQQELAAADPADEVWTWSTDHSVGFLRRRQAHEALIHRIDAELTVGIRTAIDPELASDGVTEVFEFMFTAPPWASTTPTGPIGQVEATDTGATWSVQVGAFSGTSPNTGKTYEAEPCLLLVEPDGAPAFQIAGKAANLDCWLWNRPGLGTVDCSGDPAAVEQLRAILATGVQ